MSFDIVKTVNFPQIPFQYVPQEILGEDVFEDFITLGGIISDLKHIWHAKGPCLEVRNIISGRKVGSWTFGGILKDSNTKIVAVDELKRPQGRLPLLVVALECTISGGLICIFDIFSSKVLRVVQVGVQITNLHVVDSGCENSVLLDPSPLKYFDGAVAIGTLGGNVYLLDICRQTCENAILNSDVTIRDELNPCQMFVMNKEKIYNIKKYVERSVDRDEHLAIHINVVINPSTEHFTLQGENGEDRVHVNRTETEVSSLFYSTQIASLLVGYNFGAFQLWDLRSLNLIYTSPICEDHIPVTHFTVQEPADDPKAYCYIWVSYSHNMLYHSGVPYAVMYSFYYDNKKFVNEYGSLYEDFQHCSIRFQLELGDTNGSTLKSHVKGGTCLGLQSVNKYSINKDLNSLSLCVISWLVWNSQREVETSLILFDLNQWYKEQMPRAPNWHDCSSYIIRNSLSNHVLDLKLNPKSISQFIGIQRLEEHFCPTSLSFDLWCVTDDSVLKVHNKGEQQAFIDRIADEQHLALVKPEDYFDQISALGLVPLFCDVHAHNSMDIDYQREMLLNVALEQKLIGWLCKCTSKIANNAFNACGLTIYSILNWSFERALTLKNSCDNYVSPLFDYSGTRLDHNTITLINSSITQIRNICSLYKYISVKLIGFVSDKGTLLEELRSLENVVVYFEVLLWMVNIRLLPECPRNSYNSTDDDFVSAPYMIQELTEYYDKKRAQLQMSSLDTFVAKDCLLFVDNLINNKGGANQLRQQWQEDGGSGLYPPPSLQSVLRIYFLDEPDLTFKHCLVTYTLLDIAMTVDENKKIIKLLLKFPQIFDLSQSNIKIIQAFWHLDHDDYETALEYVLDPCVLTDDLQHWHHAVMMRSLLLQKQSSLALLYLQIRKPSIQDEKDLLTIISLLISKNMLDEAFKFRQQHQIPNEQALLSHIFNECNRNELLHSLLYRRLDDDEEKAFFKYLQQTKNPRCEDLKLFYFLLRSRFLEAFDAYSGTKRRKPETQGLIGQRDATTADSIVKMFRNLLPEVNKNLVDLVRKERTNLWKEVEKPTPLSVFVHNARDNVQYKSSLVFAALSKAKQTFNTTLNGSKLREDVSTEDTPFLRTPTVFREVSDIGTPLMRSKIIEQNEISEEYGPTPSKKLKLSPRTYVTSPARSKNISSSTIQSKLSTPITRRRGLSMEPNNTTAVLPQSILKTSCVSRTVLDDSIFDGNTSVNTSLQLECENSVRRSRLALSSRMSVGRTPSKSHVKFDDLRYSSSADHSDRSDNVSHSLLPERRSVSVNSTASTLDDVFFSPENSIQESGSKNDRRSSENNKKSLSPVRENLKFDDTISEDDVKKEEPLNKKEDVASKESLEMNDLSTNRLTFQSPRSRRSYKRSFGEHPTPVRSSPRLAKKSSEGSASTSSSESPAKPSPAVQKLRGRKSLSRTVLENNARSQLGSKSLFEETTNKSSVDTTLSDDYHNDKEDINESSFDSIEELVKNYKSAVWADDNSFNNDNTKEAEVVSKITEVETIETRRETIKKRNSEELVSSRETREEYHSKKVELVVPDDEKSVDLSIFDEATQDCNVAKNEEDGTSDSCNSAATEKATQRNEEINVYDDLSSGSDDIREVLENQKKEESVYADLVFSTSPSHYGRAQGMPEKFMDSGESNSYDDAYKSSYVYENDVDMTEMYDDIPEIEKAFINDVIEIGSSSDDEERPKEKKDDADAETLSNSISSAESELELNIGNGDVSNTSSSLDEIFRETAQKSTAEETIEPPGSEKDSDDEKAGVIGEASSSKDKASSVSDESSSSKDKASSSDDNSSSSIDEVCSNIENQMERNQKEIEDAVKIIQSVDTEGLRRGEEEEEEEEHMDSLILDEASPEKQDVDEVQLKISPVNNREVVKATEILKGEGDEGQLRDMISKEILTSVITDEKNSMIAQKADSNENIESKLKVSKSLQCTLGVNDSIMEVIEDDYCIQSTSASVQEGKSDNNSEKHTISIQCSLADLTTLESSGEDISVTLTEDTKVETPLVLRSVKRTYKGKKTVEFSSDLDATPKMAANASGPSETGEQGMEESISEAKEEIVSSTNTEDVTRNNEGEDINKDVDTKVETPLVLRSVKRTYKRKKTAELSTDLDATPKLAANASGPSETDEQEMKESISEVTEEIVSSTNTEKVTRNNKGEDIGKDVDASRSQMIEVKSTENKEIEEIVSSTKTKEVTKNKEGEDIDKDVDASRSQMIEVKSTENKETEDIVSSTKTKEVTKNKGGEDIDEDVDATRSQMIEVKSTENKVTKEIVSSTKTKEVTKNNEGEDISKDVDASRSQMTEVKSMENKETEASEEKTQDARKGDEAAKPTSTMRLTRRRSMLLTQTEGTPTTSYSEESVASSSGDLKISKNKEGLNEASVSSGSTRSQTPSSRRTRRSSQLSESMFDATLLKEPLKLLAETDIMERTAFEEPVQSEAAPSKINSRRTSKQQESSNAEKQAPLVLSKKRARSASVDQPYHAGASRKRSARSKSIDLEDAKTRDIESKEILKVVLTPIEEMAGTSAEQEDAKDEIPKATSRAYSDVGAYTTSRRLTRRQASMLKTIGAIEKELEKLPEVDEIDPLQLLDKSEFKGQRDPEELKIYEDNSPSSGSGTLLRSMRSASVVSDDSTTTRKTRARSEQPTTAGIKSRLRRQSVESQSVASEHSGSPSPSKRSKKVDPETDAEIKSQSTRTSKRGRRANSVSSTKSAGSDKSSSSVKVTRRKTHSVKLDLPEITEEKGSDEGENSDTSLAKKKGKKKK